MGVQQNVMIVSPSTSRNRPKKVLIRSSVSNVILDARFAYLPDYIHRIFI